MFQDKIAIVTGGSRGIGKAISLELAKEGANIVLCGRSKDPLIHTSEEIEKIGRVSLPLKMDISIYKNVQRLIDETVTKFGRIDILINNAGSHSIEFFTKIDNELWESTINANLTAVFYCSREAAKQMIKQGGGGKIVNIASMAGKIGIAKSTHYCASKFGVIGLTQAAAMDLSKYNINVNAVGPGLVETEMFDRLINRNVNLTKKTPGEIINDYRSSIPLGRFAKAEEIAGVVLFLCSEKAKYMTGQTINVTGGWITH